MKTSTRKLSKLLKEFCDSKNIQIKKIWYKSQGVFRQNGWDLIKYGQTLYCFEPCDYPISGYKWFVRDFLKSDLKQTHYKSIKEIVKELSLLF